MAKERVFVGAEILEFMTPKRVHEDYQSLMARLHGDRQVLKLPFMRMLKKSPTTVLVFIVVDERIVSTAQGSFVELFPVDHVYVNNVATAEDCVGKGYGRRVMTALEKVARNKWGQHNQDIRMFLTSSPSKQNGGFYQSLGYAPRSADTDNPTVVWTKKI